MSLARAHVPVLCLCVAAVAAVPAAVSAQQGEGTAGVFLACDSLELSSPRGVVLESGRLVLKWRAADQGPFEVRVLDPDRRQVYGASTYGHELRVLVSRGEGTMRGPSADQLESGGTYRWSVRPTSAPAGEECPEAEFRILSAAESAEAQARFEAAAKRLGVGNEDAEPAAGLAMSELYRDEGHLVLAEAELQRLIDEGWDDPAIDRALADFYRSTGRERSLREMPGGGGTPGP